MDNGNEPLPGKPIIQFEVSRTDGNSKKPVGFELIFKGHTDSIGVLKISLTRSGDLSGRVSPAISVDGMNTRVPDWIGFRYSHADDFEEGQTTAYAYVDYEVNEENFAKARQTPDPCRFILRIDPSGQYDVGQNGAFSLDFMLPRT